MALRAVSYLKALWQKGYKPKQADYDDVWDSFFNKTDDPRSGGGSGELAISATDTTNDYLQSKFSVGDEFTTEINNPGGNESLLLKAKGWIYSLTRAFKITADRTQTFPDNDGIFAVTSMANDFAFGGQAHGGDHIQTFSASTTFNAVNGNNQEMLITASTTIGISNELPGTYIFTLEIDTGIPPTITIGASFGSPIDNNATLVDTDSSINILTLVVRSNGTKYYTINTITA